MTEPHRACATLSQLCACLTVYPLSHHVPNSPRHSHTNVCHLRLPSRQNDVVNSSRLTRRLRKCPPDAIHALIHRQLGLVYFHGRRLLRIGCAQLLLPVISEVGGDGGWANQNVTNGWVLCSDPLEVAIQSKFRCAIRRPMRKANQT